MDDRATREANKALDRRDPWHWRTICAMPLRVTSDILDVLADMVEG